jgi:predicted nucleic acid-binding protein
MGYASVKIMAALRGITRIHLDSAPLIYFVERNPVYFGRMKAIMGRVRPNGLHLSFSVITVPEVLNKPIAQGDAKLQTLYRALLTQTRNVELHPLTLTIAEKAASLRARHNLRTPDAIQIATAIETECDAFLTNDKGFTRVADLRVLILDELEL